MRALVAAAALSLAATSLGCSSKDSAADAPPVFAVMIQVESDPGKPLAKANIVYGGKTIATTDEDGAAKLELKGRQGDSYAVSVACPKGFESPEKELDIEIKHLADPGKMPEYDVSCPPETRTAFVAIRADNGANLPVLYLGREIARTDRSGAAHVVLKDLKRDAQFDLTLDTTIHGAEPLRPQSPIKSFALKGRDDVFSFDQRFTIEPKAKKSGPWRPRGPVALPTHAVLY